ncbi:hypothetical protein CBL_06458 [Carabus blaptoides fortunei]
MTSHGKIETEKLIQNLEYQLDRLVTQLEDLESSKDELDATEYNETKEDTIEQLKEFHERLDKMVKGDISLVSTLGAIQLATQAAISQAFRTPEVIRLFGRREPKLLREKLVTVEQECKLGKINSSAADQQKMEILTALRQLGEQLSQAELQFLEQNRETLQGFNNIEFVLVKDDDI